MIEYGTNRFKTAIADALTKASGLKIVYVFVRTKTVSLLTDTAMAIKIYLPCCIDGLMFLPFGKNAVIDCKTKFDFSSDLRSLQTFWFWDKDTRWRLTTHNSNAWVVRQEFDLKLVTVYAGTANYLSLSVIKQAIKRMRVKLLQKTKLNPAEFNV